MYEKKNDEISRSTTEEWAKVKYSKEIFKKQMWIGMCYH